MAFNEQKDFSAMRFSLCLSINDKNSNVVDSKTGSQVNDFIICQRYFDTYNYIEGSMQSFEFKRLIDSFTASIENELAMESRIWLTYNWSGSKPQSFGKSFIDGTPIPEDFVENGGFFDPNVNFDDDLLKPMDEPWTYTLKLTVTDNEKRGDNKVVIEKIFDATPYPKEIRENIDLTNDFKGTDTERLSGVPYIKAIIKRNRENLISAMINKIYSICSPNTKDDKSASNDSKRIQKMIYEKYLKYQTSAVNTYIYDKDKHSSIVRENKESKGSTQN